MQQPGHVSGLQEPCDSQTPPWPPAERQAPPTAWQLMHCWPPRPHSVGELPATQALPAQQPWQLLALQTVCPSQTPPVPSATHLPPLARQFPHTAPWIPHAAGSVPERHSSPKQQPLHVCEPHGGCTQVCCGEHARLELSQCRQAWPFRPHSFGSVPTRHSLPSQHPLQVEGSQTATVLPHAWSVGSQS
jgi:hypothetical protein